MFFVCLLAAECRYQSGNCGVSIVRSGEAMEQGLRDCCRSIRIGKILVESDAETHVAKVVYARFPDDIAKRQVLLMYPIMSTGNTVVQVLGQSLITDCFGTNNIRLNFYRLFRLEFFMLLSRRL